MTCPFYKSIPFEKLAFFDIARLDKFFDHKGKQLRGWYRLAIFSCSIKVAPNQHIPNPKSVSIKPRLPAFMLASDRLEGKGTFARIRIAEGGNRKVTHIDQSRRPEGPLDWSHR